MTDIRLGERLFQAANLDGVTVDHHLAQLAAIHASGLDRLAPTPDEHPEVFLMRVHGALLTSGRAVELLALYLLPLGKAETDWTPAMSSEIRAYIGALATQEARDQVYQLALEFVFGFFRRGAALLLTSLSSSAPGMQDGRPRDVVAH